MSGGNSSHHILPESINAQSKKPGRRPRRRQRQVSVSGSPSSGLLALIATIASSSSAVDGRPLISQPTALPFLYPYVQTDAPDPPAYKHPSGSHLPTPTRRNPKRGAIADKYVEGTDSRWRKTTEWTLYGSTLVSDPVLSTATPSTRADDVGASPMPSVVDFPTPSPTITSDDDILDSLPTGWRPSSATTRPTGIIVASSLVLAVMIILAISCSAYWRKKRAMFSAKDPEKVLHQRANVEVEADDDSDSDESRRIRPYKKVWVKATARWKANARYMGRRRRGKRGVHRSVDPLRSPSRSVLELDEWNGPPSQLSSHTPSLEDSADMIDQARRSHNTSPSSLPSQRDSHICPDPLPPENCTTPALPPAYFRSNSRVPALPFLDPNRTQSPPPFWGKEEGSCAVLSTVAHVATDDKSVLARMAALSSAPPISDEVPGESSTLRPSVPEWHDEELEDFTHDQNPASSSSSISRASLHRRTLSTLSHDPSSSQPFPPPPTKENMAASLFCEYPYSYEEDVAGIANFEPSAPPFEECINLPSAPPLECVVPLPSAPPFDDVDEESCPSVPYCHSGVVDSSSPTESLERRSLSRPHVTRHPSGPPESDLPGYDS